MCLCPHSCLSLATYYPLLPSAFLGPHLIHQVWPFLSHFLYYHWISNFVKINKTTFQLSMIKELVTVYGAIAVLVPESSLTNCISCLPPTTNVLAFLRYARQMAKACLPLAASRTLISLLSFSFRQHQNKIISLEAFPHLELFVMTSVLEF